MRSEERTTCRYHSKRATVRWIGCVLQSHTQIWQASLEVSTQFHKYFSMVLHVLWLLAWWPLLPVHDHSPMYDAGLGGKSRNRAIPMAEVKQHRSKDDAWLVLKGKVTTHLNHDLRTLRRLCVLSSVVPSFTRSFMRSWWKCMLSNSTWHYAVLQCGSFRHT